MEKLEQLSNNAANEPDEQQKVILEAIAAATSKVLSETKLADTLAPAIPTEAEKVVPADSAEIDLEHEPIEKKRERQRSIVLNLESVNPVPSVPTASTTGAFDQPRRSFSTKPALKGHHADSSSDEENEAATRTTSTSGVEDETSDTGAKDIDYSVLYDDTIEDFSYTSAREKAKRRLLHDQQKIMEEQAKEQQ